MIVTTSSWVKSRFSGQQPCCVLLRRDGDAIEFSDSKHRPRDGGPVLAFPLDAVRRHFDEIEKGRRVDFEGPVRVRLHKGENSLCYVMYDARGGEVYLSFTAQEIGKYFASAYLGHFDWMLNPDGVESETPEMVTAVE